MTTKHEKQNINGRQNHNLAAHALNMMIDPEQAHCSSAAPDLSVDEALASMRSMNIDVLVIVSKANDLLGVVSRGELLGGSDSGKSRDSEVVLNDVMRPANTLFTLNLSDIYSATTQDILTALSDLVEQHVIVVADNSKEIRGLFSASDIARRMGISPDTVFPSNSFAELARYLKVQTSVG